MTIVTCGQTPTGGLYACSNVSTPLYAAGTSYSPPAVASIESDGVFAGTRGNDVVIIQGANFGFDVSKVNLVQYRGLKAKAGTVNGTAATLDSNFNIYNATNCSIYTPHKALQCYTVAGAGTGLQWSVIVDGQVSVNPTYRYLPPVIYTLSGNGSVNASTLGGDVVVINGTNFGPYNPNYTLQVTYGPTGIEFIAVNCRVTINHTQITYVPLFVCVWPTSVKICASLLTRLLRTVPQTLSAVTSTWRPTLDPCLCR